MTFEELQPYLLPVAALPATAALVGLGDWLNRQVIGWLPDDPPGAGRKQHGRPIPLAGILLLPAAALWLGLARDWWSLGAVACAAVIGYLDDRGKEHDRDLDWRTKAAGLFVASGLVAMATADPFAEPMWFVAVVGFAFVLTNATNFLDNMNGVTSALAAVSLLALSGATGPFAAIGWAALGFLPFNWPRARLFLGDAGAYLLGIATAIAAVRAARSGGDWFALTAVAIQLTDFTQVVCARVALGLAPWVGDRRHLTHIVHHAGLPRWAVAPLFAGVAAAAAMAPWLWRS
ncbi:MAG: hypothetical protein NXI31_23050 [bacterium]|nr:hypothetical protein [bacterium]